jgi:hypothetical protein
MKPRMRVKPGQVLESFTGATLPQYRAQAYEGATQGRRATVAGRECATIAGSSAKPG